MTSYGNEKKEPREFCRSGVFLADFIFLFFSKLAEKVTLMLLTLSSNSKLDGLYAE